MTEKFYLGKIYDEAAGSVTAARLDYDPDDLTTHAVVTGMTGSGKTGLCIALMEEAALQGIPAILIDPKGDLCNLLLHFPDLAPQDFQPWLDPDLARRAGKTLEQAAADAASAWVGGLEEWGISHERMLVLKNAAEYAIYTPGSDAGRPVSVLSSLEAPGLDWTANREVLSERIASTVTALLGLVGVRDADPLRSREHILLSNIFQAAWSRDNSLDLTELILQVQTPPFEKLGAFPVDSFFPAKDRMALALQLNTILAAPTFEMWRTGEPLDVGSLLHTAVGRPKQSIFYLAHLSDAERMFFVTLLFTAIESWMRTQPGTASLRALLYMDEIFGYLPPTAEPPSKGPLLRMLKQARAFGLGLVLASQNPVDLDYKALSNAGTWFIGKLQTERDKLRLLDGLESAAPGTLDRAGMDKLISRLGKRVFIMQNVHEPAPVVFQTRWTMNFLAGPMTRTQIKQVQQVEQVPQVQQVGQVPKSSQVQQVDDVGTPERQSVETFQGINLETVVGSTTRPGIPSGFGEYFLPLNRGFTRAVADSDSPLPEGAAQTGLLYRPALVASAQVRFLNVKYGLNMQQEKSALVSGAQLKGRVRWEDCVRGLPDENSMDPAPDPQARFASLEDILADTKQMTALKKDFTDWVTRTTRVTIRSNPTFGLYATPEVSQAEFMKACAEAARTERDRDLEKVASTYDRQISLLEDKITREERELQQDQTELSERKKEELVSGAETVFSLLGGKRSRRISEAMSKHRLTEQSKADVEESIDSLDEYRQQLAQLQTDRQQALDEAGSKWGAEVNNITEIPLPAKRSDVYIALFGVAWMPYYLVESSGTKLELPAFE